MNASCVRVAAGVCCQFLSILLMNQSLFPLFDSTFTYARDISILFCAAVLITAAIVVLWRPGTLRAVSTTAVVVAGTLAGTACMAAGVLLGQPVLLVVGACAAVTCRSFSTVVVSLAVVTLPAPRATVCVVAGMFAAYLLDLAVVLAGLWAGALASVVVLPLCMLALCWPMARGLVETISSSHALGEVSVTRPASFLPFTSTLYVFQFIVFVVFGFALRFGEVDGLPSFRATLTVAVLAVLLVWTCARRGRISFDNLAGMVILTFAAGVMLAAVHTADGAFLANTLLLVGNALFGIFMICTLMLLAQRNPVGSFSIFCWMNGIGSLGTTLGAFVGTTANTLVARGDTQAVSYILIVLLLLFLTYVLFALRSYSFHSQIESVEAVDLSEGAPATPQVVEETIDERCHVLAQRYGLTPREEETFAMLARGRNREFIENALTVSRNTVKAHVKHVYAKLDIHSHQELIDLVEADRGKPETRS